MTEQTEKAALKAKTLVNLSMRHRRRPMVSSLVILSVYVLGFLLLEPILGPGAVVLCMLPVVGIGWLLELRGGLVAGLLSFPLNVLLLNLAGEPGLAILLGPYGLPASIAVMMLGALVGQFSSLRLQLDDERLEFNREVEEHRRTEEALRESEGHYKAVVENVADAIAIGTWNERFFVNKAYMNLYGFTNVAQAIATPLDELIHPDDREAIKARILSLQDGHPQPGPYEYRIRRNDGEVRSVQNSAVPITYKGHQASLAVIRDITERKQAESALRESEERFRKVFEHSNDAIFIVDPERDAIVSVNSKACWMLGYRQEELLAMPLSAIHPNEVPRLQAFACTVFERGHGWTDQLTCTTSSGQVLLAEVSASTVEVSGRLLMIAMVRDITERKRAEELERLRSQEFETLVNIANLLVRPESFEAKCNGVLKELSEIAQGERMVLRLYDEKEEGLRLVASAGDIVSKRSPPPLVRSGEKLAGLAFQRGEAIVANDYRTYPVASDSLVELGVRSGVALPIQVGGDRLGVLSIHSLHLDHFTPERVRLLTAVANGIGALLDNARLYQEKSSQLEQGRRRLKAFQAAASKLALAKLPEEALQNLVDTARELIEARYGALVLWDDQGHIATWVVSGLSPEVDQAVDGSPRGLGLLSLVRDGNKSVRLNDVPGDPKDSGLPQHHPPMKTFLGVPIVYQGRSTGAFYVTDREDGAEFTEDDERLLNVFAVLAGVHLENASLYEAVTRERSTLAAVQGSMNEGLVVINPEGRVTYFNKAAETLLKFTSAEMLGKSIQEALLKRTLDFESQETLESLLSMLREGVDKPVVVEMVMLRPERCRLSMTIFPITNSPETRMTGLVVRDVTQEREMEQRRNAFISLASHELRTPMTSILGFTELLLDREPPKPLRREWLDRILRDSIRLNAVVDDLLDVSRIQSGKAPVNQEELSLQSLAEEQLSTFVPRTTKHKFVMDFPPDLPSIVGDHQKLGQILTNLLENAIKYSPNGGQIRISAYLDLDRKRVVTAISDQGIGIAADDQRALFTTFCRIYRPETGNVSGTGLGLYIVKGLVELMNGEVWLDSELGKGSTFFFSTPAAIGVTQEQTVAGIGVLPSRL